MHTLAKPFAIVVSLGWMALWAVTLLLMWRPSSEARITTTDFNALGTIDAADTARWIGAAVAALAIALAVPVLLAALRPAPERVTTPVVTRGASPPLVPDHPDIAHAHDYDGVHDEELPASLRRASTGPVAVTAPQQPSTVRTERTDDSSIEARLERQEAELRRLREQLIRHPTPASREAVLPERENSHALRDRA